MFPTMSRQQYSYQTGPVPRQNSNHGTSSAFSASANPDEDWTQISDLAERRRIQNRIAQRNYRKKLKRRLEDLERRASSSSASPPQTYAEVKPSSSNSTPRKNSPQTSQQQSSSSSRSQKLSPRSALQHNAYTPPLSNEDDLFSVHNFSSPSSSGAHTPPYFGYSGYPSPEADFSLYPAPSYSTTTASSYPAYPAYRHEDPQYAYMSPPQQTLPTLPSMAHFDMQPKKEDMGLNPFSMSYASMAGLDMTQNQYDDGTYPGDSSLSL